MSTIIKVNGIEQPANIRRIVIYNNGEKLFTRDEGQLTAYEQIKNNYGNMMLHEIYGGEPVEINLKNEIKNARIENLNRKDNYFINFSPDYDRHSIYKALYINANEISVENAGDMLAAETKDEKNYLKAAKLTFHCPVKFNRYHIEHIQADDHWKIPDNGKWGEYYGKENAPCYYPYDYTDSPFEKSRKMGKGVIKRWFTTETIENGAEILATERYYTKTEYSEDRKRRMQVADFLKEKRVFYRDVSHYELEKLESVLKIKLELPN